MNDGALDLYTPEILQCRRSGIITGLPDGRGRIIGDYRRVALYGVDRLIEAKKADRAELDARWPSEEVMRLREEMANQLRALADLKTMAASYGHDIGRPPEHAREAVPWTYFRWPSQTSLRRQEADLPPRAPLCVRARAPCEVTIRLYTGCTARVFGGR